MKDGLKNPFIRQYVLEILLPIVGFYFLDWSLTIIAIFYLMDQLAAEFAFSFRMSRVSKNIDHTRKSILYSVIPFALYIIALGIQGLFILKTWYIVYDGQGEQIMEEISDFVFPEGLILLPLVILIYLIKDRFTFYIPRRYMNHHPVRYMQMRLIRLTTTTILVCTGFTIWYKSQPEEETILISFLIGKVLYDLTLGKWLEKASLN